MLFHCLEGTEAETPSRKEKEKIFGDPNNPSQVAKYIHGVGDSADVIQKFAEGHLASAYWLELPAATPIFPETTWV